MDGVGRQGGHTCQGPPFSFPACPHPQIPEVTNHPHGPLISFVIDNPPKENTF